MICQTGAGRYYYRGVGLGDGLSVGIDDPVPTGASFVATDNGVRYQVSPSALVITQGFSVLSDEDERAIATGVDASIWPRKELALPYKQKRLAES